MHYEVARAVVRAPSAKTFTSTKLAFYHFLNMILASVGFPRAHPRTHPHDARHSISWARWSSWLLYRYYWTKKYIFGSLHDKKWNYRFNAKMKSWLDMRKQYSTWVSSFFLKKEIPFAFLVAIIAQKANFYVSWSLIIFWNHQCFEIKIWNCFDFTNILSKQTIFLLF